MARMQVCKLLRGVSQPIHIFLEPRLHVRLTHPSKDEFLPTSQSSKTQSFGRVFNKNSANVLFPVFLTPTNIIDSFYVTQLGRFTQGYEVSSRDILELDLMIASVLVFSIVLVIFSFSDNGKAERYLSNLIGFPYLLRLKMHVLDDECDLTFEPLIIKYSFSLMLVI